MSYLRDAVAAIVLSGDMDEGEKILKRLIARSKASAVRAERAKIWREIGALATRQAEKLEAETAAKEHP